jgi:LysM repeat protein
MNFIKKGLFTLGTTVALTGAFAIGGQDVDAASWEARTVEEVQADFSHSDNGEEAYTIQWGDTLGVIARAAEVDVSQLAAVNEINNANLIMPGNTLRFSSDHTTVSVEDQATHEVETYEVAPAAPVEEVTPEPVPEPAPEPAPAQPEAQPATTQVSGSEAAAKEWIAQRESNGSYTAVNGQYWGRYQLNPTLVEHGAGPAEQEAAADKYVSERYGSWTNAQQAWMQQGWY